MLWKLLWVFIMFVFEVEMIIISMVFNVSYIDFILLYVGGLLIVGL